MINFEDPRVSFILFTLYTKDDYIKSKQLYERALSIFYSKDYSIIPISNFSNNSFSSSILAIADNHTNEELRNDSIFMIDNFDNENVIVKYKNEENAVRLNRNGSETHLRILENKKHTEEQEIFINEGYFFSFLPLKRYYYPKDKRDLKEGMVVEFFNNQNWVEKSIQNLDDEYNKLYKLLIKYKKLRVEINQN